MTDNSSQTKMAFKTASSSQGKMALQTAPSLQTKTASSSQSKMAYKTYPSLQTKSAKSSHTKIASKKSCSSRSKMAFKENYCDICDDKTINTEDCRRFNLKVQERLDGGKGLYRVDDDDSSGTKLPTSENKLLFPPLCPPVLYKDCRTTHCAYCMKRIEDKNVANVVKVSTNPRYPVFLCSKECHKQTIHWLPSETAMFLTMLMMNESMIVLPMIVILYRAALNMFIRDEIMSLHSHSITTTNYNATEDELIHQHCVLSTVTFMLQNTQRQGLPINQNIHNLKVEQLTDIYQRIKFNAFTICSEEVQQLGIALFAGPAYRMNHSCDPNARQTYLIGETGQAPKLLIEFIKPIHVGDEICISYTDNKDTCQTRRQFLLQNYHFFCNCVRCAGEE